MKLKPLPADKVIRVLNKLGFQIIRRKGSHIFLKHPDGRATVVPFHPDEDIGRGLLMKIIKDTKISKEKFMEMIE
ncbi:MAG: type II toxin-antitoxin system HicA family toxin [Candidatus Odinarchaeum yellowstonii]|uniref:Type II toxin-antitoxin system HicA family toxin n=1 Tax=Odinarchaeota yellowstonii (strain LCB_4) TaxID=1841599 RepID=A0AAF0D274_ODILC|nr:MAG: type II toxin-antitoxin system HicA family toxin [Candidatus Odinarchaeum yellowstonii]